MQAQALVCDDDESVSLVDVSLPEPGEDEVVVRTGFSGISIGTEMNLIRGNVDWGPYPICTGYQGVGTVERVGTAVTGVTEGDAVYFGGNADLELEDGTEVSSVQGTHCSRAVVDPSSPSFGHLPDGIDRNAASLFVMPAVGLNGVDKANVRLGDSVAVHGTGLVGLGVVASCRHRGADVIAIDLEADRLAVARKLGAEHTIDASENDVENAVEEIEPDGCDVVFEATGIPDCIDLATPLVRRGGKFVFQGDYGEEPFAFKERRLNAKQLTGFFPAGFGGEPGPRAVLRNMASGALSWSATITHRPTSEEAPAIYDRLLDGERGDILGLTVQW